MHNEREREREDECVWMAGRKVEVVREIFRLPEREELSCESAVSAHKGKIDL